jgi:predicted enzyme related to lactoylglutathione lyase
MKTARRSNVLSSPCFAVAALGVVGPLEMTALFRKVDCHSIPVADLDAALAFYRDGLGHELIWRDDSAAGLRLPDSDAELVLHTDERPIETDLLVASVPAAISRFVEAGGKVVAGPFEIRIGLCAMIEDPWQNRLVILDSSKGSLRTDAEGNVIESGAA